MSRRRSMTMGRRLITWLTRWPFAMSLVALVGTVVIGTAARGPGFIARPLPLPPWFAVYWLTTNGILCFVAICYGYRNLVRFRSEWSWQEVAIGRGLLWILAGACLGYLTHLFTDPDSGYITLGTPSITLGVLVTIWGCARPPERFAEERAALVKLAYDRGVEEARREREVGHGGPG